MLPHSQKQYPPWKKSFWGLILPDSLVLICPHNQHSFIKREVWSCDWGWSELWWQFKFWVTKKKKKTKIIHSSFYQVQILKSCLYWSSHHHLHHDLHCSLWPDEGHTPSVSPCCSGSVLVSNVSILVIKVCLCHFVILLNSLFLNKMWVFNRHFIRSLQNVHL